MKKIISLLCALSLICSFSYAYAYDEQSLTAAKALYDLGLLKGNSTAFSAESMDLDNYATRAQVAVTITRMLGNDEKARYQKNPHPFYDVPEWASDYVGWLYENYLVNGHSDTYFGANDTATLSQFCAMMLRVLGYYENEGDFEYKNAVSFALSVGLIDRSMVYKYELVRSDMVKICLKALSLPMKNSYRILAEKLRDGRVITSSQLAEIGIYERNALDSAFSNVENNLPQISAVKKDGYTRLKFDSPIEHYGIRVFYTSSTTPSAVQLSFDTSDPKHFEKGSISYLNGGSAGYISYVNVYGLENESNLKFIVIKTSSEGELYDITGKTNIDSL